MFEVLYSEFDDYTECVNYRDDKLWLRFYSLNVFFPRLFGKISLHFFNGKSFFCQNTYDFDQISKSIGTNIL